MCSNSNGCWETKEVVMLLGTFALSIIVPILMFVWLVTQ